MDVIDGPKLRSAPNLVNEQLCHKQSAISPVTTPVIEVFCDDGPLTGNQMRFVLSTKDAQLVLCDVHVYGGHYVNKPIKHTSTFKTVKVDNFHMEICDIFLIFAKKHRLWVHDRAA